MYSTRSRQPAAVHRQLLRAHTPSAITSKSSTFSKSEQQEQPQQHQQQQELQPQQQSQSQSQSSSQLSSLLELQSQTQLQESEILEIEKSSTIKVTNSSTQTAAHIANIISNNNNSKIVNNKNSKTDNQLYYNTSINSNNNNNNTSNNRIDAHSSNNNRNIGDYNNNSNNNNNNNSRKNIRSNKNSNNSSVIVINKNRPRRFRGIKRSTTTTTTTATASTTVTPAAASTRNAGIETPLASIGHYNSNNSYSGNNGNQPLNDVVLSHISGSQRMGRPSGLTEDKAESTAATTPTTQTQISTSVTASPKFMSAPIISNNNNNNSGHNKNVATVTPMIRAHEQSITSSMYSYPVAGASTMSDMSTSDFAGSQRSSMHAYSSSTEHAPTNPMDEQARHLHRGRRARQRAKRLEAYHLRRSLKTMNKFLRKTVFTLRCIRALMLQQVQMTRALNSNMSLFD